MVSEIDTFVVATAYAVYRKLTNSPANKNTFNRFKKMLGMPESGSVFDHLDSEEVKQRIAWMAGPNAEVMWKIWQAQNRSTHNHSITE